MIGDLLGLREEIIRVAIEHHPTDDFERDDLLGNELGRIEDIEIEAIGGALVEALDAEFLFGKVALLDRFKQIAAVKIGIGAADLDGLVPDHRDGARDRAPMKLDEGGLALGVDHAESVDAEPLIMR